MPRLLALSGSLREGSSNTELLRAAQRLSPPGLEVELYAELAELPHFNPDLSDCPPPSVQRLQAAISAADGLLISCPEYARGIPGSLKNLLDWLVSSEAFPGKPVALFNASARASHAQAALRLVLETMSARLVEPASITVNLLGGAHSAQSIAAEVAWAAQIGAALRAFAEAL